MDNVQPTFACNFWSRPPSNAGLCTIRKPPEAAEEPMAETRRCPGAGAAGGSSVGRRPQNFEAYPQSNRSHRVLALLAYNLFLATTVSFCPDLAPKKGGRWQAANNLKDCGWSDHRSTDARFTLSHSVRLHVSATAGRLVQGRHRRRRSRWDNQMVNDRQPKCPDWPVKVAAGTFQRGQGTPGLTSPARPPAQ